MPEKKWKLKSYVIPTIYVVAIATVIVSILLVGRTLQNLETNEPDDSTHVVNTITDDDENTIPVINEGETNNRVIKPFTIENITVKKEYYDYEAADDSQQNALILYENTYMQNSGILYQSAEAFEVVATLDGTISNIKEDDLLGIVIEISHSSKLTTVYQGLKEAKVVVGANVSQGEVIGISGTTKLDSEIKNGLLFEVFHNGSLMNPENYYGMEKKNFE